MSQRLRKSALALLALALLYLAPWTALHAQGSAPAFSFVFVNNAWRIVFNYPLDMVAVARLNNQRFVDMFPGADLGAKMNAAVADCAGAGCTYFVVGNGTIATPPDFPVGSLVNFNPNGSYALATHWVIYHRGTTYNFNGAHIQYTLDDGQAAVYVGKQTSAVVNSTATTVTWVSGSLFTHVDVGDQVYVDSGSFGASAANVAAVSADGKTITFTTGSFPVYANKSAIVYLTSEAGLGAYASGAPVVINGLNLDGPTGGVQNNIALETELTSGITVNGFTATNFLAGTCLKLLGAITGNYSSVHCNVDKNGIVLDQNAIGGFWVSTANANRFYGVDLEAGQSASGLALLLNGAFGNLISGLRVESNLDHVSASIQSTTALGYPATPLDSGGNRIQVLDFERNGDTLAGAQDIAVSGPGIGNVIEGGSFTSIGGTLTGVTVQANSVGTVLRDTAFFGYATSYNYLAGATGQISNIKTSGAVSNPPYACLQSGACTFLQAFANYFAAGGAFTGGIATGDMVVPNTHCLWADNSTHNANFKLVCSNATSQVVLDPGNQGINLPNLHSVTGTRFLCVDTAGNVTAQAAACSGT